MSNKCIICGNTTHFYFEKQFDDYNFTAKYFKCENCGFVISNTHAQFSQDEWLKANKQYHSSYLWENESPDDINWIVRIKNQSELINDLYNKNIIKSNNWVDYGCGDGKLSDILQNKFKLNLKKYDIEFKTNSYISYEEVINSKWDLFVLTSVLEHVCDYTIIDQIFSATSNTGCLALHTFISNEVTNDPDWFYLLPVHCAFHTNKSMQILFERYNYNYCAYNYDARMWFLFKHLNNNEINILNHMPNLVCQNTFVDFWK